MKYDHVIYGWTSLSVEGNLQTTCRTTNNSSTNHHINPRQSFIPRSPIISGSNCCRNDNNNFQQNITYHRISDPGLSGSKPLHSRSASPFSVDPNIRFAQRRMSEASYTSMDSTAQWNEDFSHRPSWCDAKMALKQIQRGKAKGNKPALWVRRALQYLLFRLGCFIQKHAGPFLFLSFLFMGVFCVFLRGVRIQTDIVKLWVEDGGRLHEELNFLDRIKRETERQVMRDTNRGESTSASMTPDGGLSGGFQVLIQTPRKNGLNILTQKDLLLHAEVLTNISSMSVNVFDEKWSLADLCFKPPPPQVEAHQMTDVIQVLLDKIVPCVVITPLDCFWEGAKPLGPFPPIDLGNMAELSLFIPSLPRQSVSWKNLHPANVIREVGEFFDLGMLGTLFERAGIRGAYQNRPCIDPFDPECPKSAENYPDFCGIVEYVVRWNRNQTSPLFPLSNETLEELKKPPVTDKNEQETKSAEENENHDDDYYDYLGDEGADDDLFGGLFGELGIILELRDTFSQHAHLSKPQLDKHNWTPEKAQEVLDQWQRNFTSTVYNWVNNSEGERQVHPLASTSVADMLKEFSAFKPFIILIGYLLMLIYAGLSLCSCRERGVQSCSGLGVAGVLLVTFASLSGLGLSTILQIEFNAATTQIVPFLTLGLGVDDMFLLVHNYKEIVGLTTGNQLGYLLKETGLSVLLTSVNNIMAFMAGGLLPVPALRSFCFQTAILLFFNVIAMLTMFPAIMAMDLERRNKKRVDVFCCIKIKKDKIRPSSAAPTKSKGPPPPPTPPAAPLPRPEGEPPPTYEMAVQNGGLVLPHLEEKGADPMQEDTDEAKNGCLNKMGFLRCTLHHFVIHVYTPMLKITAVKVAVILFFLCLLGMGVIGLTRVQMGLELTDVIPRDTAPYAFLAAREKYFSFYPMYAVIKGSPDFDFPHKQAAIRDYREAIGQSEYTVTNQGKLGEQYWLSLMLEWLDTLQMKYDVAQHQGFVTNSSIDDKASDEAKLAFKLICNKGDLVDCSRNGKERLIDRNGNILPDGFYNYLTAWYNVDPMMYYVSQASFYPNPPKWDTHETKIPPAKPPLYSQIPFFVNKLVDTPATVDAIRKIREICDRFAETRGLPNFPQGIPFTFWEQYLHLTWNLMRCLLIITICVFVVITLLLMSPWTSMVVVSVLVMMVVELCGFMGIAGLKLNPVSAVSLITAVGIGVEFTVHISLSYLTALGSRNERMAHTLDHMFVPVLHGGMSTLLGIIMLAFSEFEFIVRYFFMVMSTLIILGLLNGLLLLPVLLSILGPKSEVRPTDGSNYLAPPTPTMKPRKRVPGTNLHSTDLTELDPMHDPQHFQDGVGIRRTPPSVGRRHSFNRPPSGSIPYRRHDSLSTIDEESTPPSSATPPGAGGAVVTVAPVHVVVHTSAGGRQATTVVPKNGRSWTVSGGSPVTTTVKAKAKVQVQLHHSQGLPTTTTTATENDEVVESGRERRASSKSAIA